MELFTVNRYTEEQFETAADTDEKVLLEKLLKKAEKRKRKKNKKILENENQQDLQDAAKKFKNITIYEKEDIDIDTDPIAAVDTEIAPPPGDVNGADDVDDTEADKNFQVLGDPSVIPKEKAKYHIPRWLAKPVIVSTEIPKDCDERELDECGDSIQNLDYLESYVVTALKDMSVKRLFPVQTTIIPWMLREHSKPWPLRPRDICVSAPTGSGKTLAFAIPVVQLLQPRVERKIRALVVLPVAELALQVFKVFKKLCSRTVLNVCLLSNQTPFEMEQAKLLEAFNGKMYSKADIVVTTPGRLVDHLRYTKGFCLKSLQILVIDEADRIMDAAFQNWLDHLDEHSSNFKDKLPSGRAPPLCVYNLLEFYDSPQKLLFSATLTHDPEKLHNLRLFQPKCFASAQISVDELAASLAVSHIGDHAVAAQVNPYATPAELSEKYCITEARLKPLTLFALIKVNGWKKFLCFTNSGEASNRLAFVLGHLLHATDLKVKDLSANLSPAVRSQTLNQFARGDINGIICSDALARGIDVPDVDIVISYDMPRHIKTYIHRIGRTARAGRKGTAVTLVTQNELKPLKKMLHDVGKSINEELIVPTEVEEKYAQSYTFALNKLKYKVESSKNKKLVNKKRLERKTQAHNKDPTELTLMEKLQINAGDHVEKAIKKSKNEETKRKVSKRKISSGVFNPNAGKRRLIEK